MSLLALSVVMAIGRAGAETHGLEAKGEFPCPSGQIYRVSKKICVPKGASPKVSARSRAAELPSAPQKRETRDGGAPAESAEPVEAVPESIRDAATQDAPHAPRRFAPEESTFDRERALESVIPLRLARESTTARLEQIVAFCRMVLETDRGAEKPVASAAVRNNLANALVALEEKTNGTAGLQEAVALYREALKERTHERASRDRATVQTNLGEALTLLGVKENAVPELTEAAAMKREALAWAKRSGDEGIALMRLAEQLGDKAKARAALAQIDSALATIRNSDQDSLLGLYFEEQLPEARALVERLNDP